MNLDQCGHLFLDDLVADKIKMDASSHDVAENVPTIETRRRKHVLMCRRVRRFDAANIGGSVNNTSPDHAGLSGENLRPADIFTLAVHRRHAGYTVNVAGVGDLVGWVRNQVMARVPRADLDQRDPDFIRDQLAGAWLLASVYFRADVRGLDRIPPKGPVLLVGNHSGGTVPVDSAVFMLAFCSYFGVERPIYQLAHNLVVSAPGLGWLRKFGTVAASHENSRLALESGAVLLVYPGGDYEDFRPSWQRHVVDFGGRTGFVRLARDTGVPIVPVAAVGGQETALFLGRGEWLAKLLRLDKMLRAKVLPLMFGLPWGLNIGLLGHIPLPAKIVIEVQEPIEVNGDNEAIYDKVVGSLQAGVDRLAAERRLPVIG